MPMTERNKLLAEAFGHCWHEKSDVYIHQCKNCDSEITDTSLISQSIEYLRPDYFTLVTLKCDKCGGTGRRKECSSNPGMYCPIEDCKPDLPVIDDFKGCRLVKAIIDCPCQGKPRIISEFQRVVEERGEWDAFVLWAMATIPDFHNALTDLIKLADAYLEWKKV